LSNVCPVSLAALAIPQPEMARQESRTIAVLATNIDSYLSRVRVLIIAFAVLLFMAIGFWLVAELVMGTGQEDGADAVALPEPSPTE
jgi:hypothetical protein